MSDLTLAHTINDAGQLTITLDGRLTIETVANLHELLKEQLKGVSVVKLDITALEAIDLTGMQLICSACWTAESQGTSLRFTDNRNPCLVQAINDLGLHRHTTCKHNSQISCILCGGVN